MSINLRAAPFNWRPGAVWRYCTVSELRGGRGARHRHQSVPYAATCVGWEGNTCAAYRLGATGQYYHRALYRPARSWRACYAETLCTRERSWS